MVSELEDWEMWNAKSKLEYQGMCKIIKKLQS